MTKQVKINHFQSYTKLKLRTEWRNCFENGIICLCRINGFLALLRLFFFHPPSLMYQFKSTCAPAAHEMMNYHHYRTLHSQLDHHIILHTFLQPALIYLLELFTDFRIISFYRRNIPRSQRVEIKRKRFCMLWKNLAALKLPSFFSSACSL